MTHVLVAAVVATQLVVALATPAEAAGGDLCTLYGGVSDRTLTGEGVEHHEEGDLYIAATSQHAIYKLTPDGILSVVAGRPGSAGFSGDGGAGTRAQLSAPSDVAIAGRGLYIADAGNHRIRLLDLTTGAITTVAGNGDGENTVTDGATATAVGLGTGLSGIDAVTVTAGTDAVFLADHVQHVIWKVTVQDGSSTITRVAGVRGTAGYVETNLDPLTTPFNAPMDVQTLDATGDVYVADTGNDALRFVDTDGAGTVTTIWDRADTPALSQPRRLAGDGAATVYVAYGLHIGRTYDAGTGRQFEVVAGRGDNWPGGDGVGATTVDIEARGLSFRPRTGEIGFTDGLRADVMQVLGADMPTCRPETDLLSATYTATVGSPVAVSLTSRDPDDAAETLAYTVDFGDGSAPSSGVVDAKGGADASHTYRAAGTYTVTASVTDPGLAVGRDTATIVVSEVVAPTIGVALRGSASVPAGAAAVPLASIPVGAVQDALRDTTASTPLASVPLASVPLASVPLASVDLGSTPLASVPLASVPLASVPLASVPLASVPLASVPLASVGGWEAVIAGTPLASVPLASVTLQDVLDDPTAAARLAAIPLASVDLSATPLASVALGSIALGFLPLASVPIGDPNDGTGNVADWQALLATLGYGSVSFDQTTTLLTLDLAGVPLASVPLASVPLASVDLSSVPLASVPLASVPLASVDLSSTPLASVPLASVDLQSAPLASVPLASVPLASVPTPGDHFDCTKVDCSTGTFRDAAAAGAILPATTLHDVWVAVTGHQDADGERITVGDLIFALPDGAEPTIGDVLIGLLIASDFPWEDLPLADMELQRYGGGFHDYHVDFTLTGDGSSMATTATVDLPEGFSYVGGAELTSVANGLASSRSVIADTTTPGTLVVPLGELVSDPAWSYNLRIPLAAAIELGVGKLAATVEAGGAAGSDSMGVTTTENYEDDNDALASAPTLTTDTLYLSHIATPGEIDYFKVPVPPAGSRLQIELSHLGADNDLVVYSPVAPGSTPLASVPLASVPLASVPFDDDLAITGDGSIAPSTLQDIPLASVPLASVSTNRSTADEDVAITTTSYQAAAGGHYTIQVSGYNGAAGPDPYVLRVKVRDPLPAPHCVVTFPHDPGTASTLPTIATGVDTLFLVNRQRLTAAYGAAAAGDVLSSLDDLVAALSDSSSTVGHLGLTGAVVPLDAYEGIRAAYTAWDQASCDPLKANDVADAIIAQVRTIQATHSTVQNLVIVGGDEQIPMVRLADMTSLSNERDYATGPGDYDANAGTLTHNPLTSAFLTEHILSDDPYGDADPLPWLDRALFVPDVAVGRLVEAPADMVAQLAQFEAAGGTLDPRTALTTGYDFLTDGAAFVDEGLSNRLPDADRSSIVNETWTRQDVVDALFPAGGTSPDIASVNAHYDHFRSLPAVGNATHDESDLFTVDDVPMPPSGTDPALAEAILFTMGCHGGLNVPDLYVGASSTKASDWAQTFGAQRAVYVGNTGFGYGDTEAVALSERLMGELAQRLDGSVTVGEALMYAKQAYFGDLGQYGVYDEKALMEATFYGLPMYRIGSTPPASATPTNPSYVTVGTPTGTGTVQSSPVSLTLPEGTTLVPRSTSRGTYWTVAGEVPQVTHYRPIQPRTTVDVTQSGLVAHGAILTGLQSTDIPVDGVFSRPTVDLSSHEPEVTSAVDAFPAYLLNLGRADTPVGERQNLVVMPGQYFAGDDGNGGVQRLYTSVQAEVLYVSGDAEHVAPRFTRALATISGGNVTFEVDVTDTVDAAGTAGSVGRVLVLFKDDTGWHPLELTPTGSGPTWTATSAVSGSRVEFLAQAVDGSGNTAATTDKGRLFDAFPAGTSPDAPPSTPRVKLSGTAAQNGWYAGDVTVTPSGAEGVTYTTTVDGAPGSAVAGDGVHTVEVVGSDGGYLRTFVSIDTTAPTVALTGVPPTIVQGSQHRATVTCADAISGVASCPHPGPLDTSTIGQHTVSVTATDRSGLSATGSLTYTVVSDPDVTFSGTSGNDGWYLGNVTVDVAPQTGVTYTVTVDGVTTSTVTGDGSHAVVVTGDDGSREEHTIRIDATAPTIADVAVPAYIRQGATSGWSWTCADVVSGVASCTDPAALPTATLGKHTFHLTATDRAGHTTSHTVTYTVYDDDGIKTSEGFLAPVTYDTVYMKVKHGRTIPLKWRMTDMLDRYIRDTASFQRLTYAPSTLCSEALEYSTITDETLDVTGITYDLVGEHFVYPFKTSSLPSGCQRVTVHVYSGGITASFSVVLDLR